MISTTAVDRLMQLGRRRGGLQIDDIRQALPVDTMTIDELADVMARLEEAGIAVEIDASMLTPHHRKMTLPEVNPTSEPTRHSERATTAYARLLGLASSIKAARENSHRARGPARTYVQKSGTIFVVAAALILILLALVVWRFA
jgi:Sigma-70 factor, region 1.1